jgi:hypothetical protein
MSICTEIEVLGKSSQSWERAAAAAVKAAVESFADRCLVRRASEGGLMPTFTAEVVKLEMSVRDGEIEQYRAKVKVSFVHSVDSSSQLVKAPTLTPVR